MTDEAMCETAPVVGTKAACPVIGESRNRHYSRHPKSPAQPLFGMSHLKDRDPLPGE